LLPPDFVYTPIDKNSIFPQNSTFHTLVEHELAPSRIRRKSEGTELSWTPSCESSVTVVARLASGARHVLLSVAPALLGSAGGWARSSAASCRGCGMSY
jgi:hypothetical protein